MKKSFLTLALMCCVSFAFANDNTKGIVEPIKEKTTSKVVGYQIITSCGTQIDMHADETNNAQVLDNVLYYECQHCGEECPPPEE